MAARQNAPTCRYCRAPLPLQTEAEIVTCQYCGTDNDLRPPPPKKAPAPAAAKPARPSLGRDSKIALGVFGLSVVVGLVVSLVHDRSSGSPVSSSSSVTPPSPSEWPEAEALQDERTQRPLEIDWIDEDEFVVDGYAELTGRVHIASDGQYTLMLKGFPEGTRWTVGDREGRIDTDYARVIELDNLRDQLGAAPADDVGARKLGIESNLTLVVPLVGTGESALPEVSAGFAIRSAIDAVENGRPLRFENEPEPTSSTSIVLSQRNRTEVFGPAETIDEVDLVAFVTKLPEVKGEVVCSGYEDSDGDPRPDLTIRLKEYRVRVFDRRTGELAHERVVPPRDDCPTYRFDDDTERDSYRPSDEIEEWLRSLL